MYLFLSWIMAFTLAIGVDWSYAKWVLNLAERRRAPASFFSALCTVLGSVSVLVCVNEYSAVVPTALGHALGTWIAVGKKEN